MSTIKIHIEPLRKRPEDIPYLIDHYIKSYTEKFAGKSLSIPTPKAIDQLIAYVLCALSYLYAHGLGVHKSLIKAYAWNKLIAEQGWEMDSYLFSILACLLTQNG